MPEKRFTYSKKPHYYGNVIDNGRMLGYADVVDLLNEQHEQIERLKRNFKALDELKCEIAEENEQLKSRINDYDVALKRLQDLADRKLKENEQLKKQIERIDFILDDLNGAEYISRDDGIKALNKIDKVIGKR